MYNEFIVLLSLSIFTTIRTYSPFLLLQIFITSPYPFSFRLQHLILYYCLFQFPSQFHPRFSRKFIWLKKMLLCVYFCGVKVYLIFLNYINQNQLSKYCFSSASFNHILALKYPHEKKLTKKFHLNRWVRILSLKKIITRILNNNQT